MRTTVRGGAGQDFITGGFGGELLAGGDGDDLILGHGGDDALLGEGGDDALQADEGEDEVLGGDGDDRTYVWEPDGDDRIDGGAGDDLTQIRGTYRDDRFEVRAAALPGHVRVARDGGAQKPDLTGVERLEILTSTGSDIVLGDQHLAGLIALSADLGAGNDYAAGGDEADHFDGGPDDDDLRGGPGDDTLTAGPGGDEMEGGDGDDTLAGGTGVDELSGDAGNDRFTWTTGDEAGLADGGEGVDTFAVTGSDDKDGFTLRNEAAPGTSSLTRHGASERSTLRDVETVEAATAGGDDLMVATSTRTGVRLDGGPGADQFRFGGTEAADQYTALRTRAPGHVRVINDKLPVNHDLVATELFDVVAFGGDDTATIGPGWAGRSRCASTPAPARTACRAARPTT